MHLSTSQRRSGARLARRIAGAAVIALAVVAVAAPLSRGQDKPPAPPTAPNLDDIEIDAVTEGTNDADAILKLWARKLKVPIFIDQQMAGTKIKFLQSDVKLTWGLFKKILDFYDIVLDEKEVNGHWIMFAHLRRNIPAKVGPPFPVVRADSNEEKSEKMPPREEIVTAVIQVNNGAGNDIFATVRGLLVRDVNRIGNILYVRGPEVIIIVDYASNVEYYLKVIRALDVQAPGQITRIIQINFAPAEDIVRVVQSLLRGPGQGGPGGPPGMPVGIPGTATLQPPQVIADQRTNKLIVQAYKHQFPEIERLIGELDVKAPNRPPKYHIYKCQNVDADYLAGKLQQLLTGQGGGPSKRGSSQSGGGKPGQGAAPAPSAPVTINSGGGNQQQKTDVFSVETRIVPDELSNSLLIQAEEPIYQQVLTLLQGGPDGPGLDRAPRRVLVETQVWEVGTPADNMTIGFELAGLQNTKKGEFRPEAATSFGLSQLGFDPTTGSITRTPNVGTGLTAVLTKDIFNKLPVIMTAIASFDKSRAITTPFALTNDNQPAHFDVTLTTSYATNTLTTGFSQQSFQQLQIPTSIDVTPQVNSEDNLTLDVKIAISTASAPPGPGAPPNVNARNLNAVVTVPNMHYVVFGGLETESYEQIEQKVPFLGDIPILGHLFKTKTWNHNKDKIYIFVRATIFTNDKALTRVSEDMREQAHVLAEQDEWIPPVVSERLLTAPWKTVQDDVFDVFGTGSGNPFGATPKDE